jgi:deazaflavin-dependent oxidoreductase (nitroreductase family)
MSNESNEGASHEIPRPNSSIYKFALANEEVRIKTLKKWNRLNKYLIVPLYRIGLLPALGFGRIFLLLKTKGWKTGKTRRNPVEYHWINDIIHIFSGRGEDAAWVKNMRANPDKVGIRHGFHWFQPLIEFVEDLPEKEEIFKWYVTKHPRAAKMLFGWDPKIDDPDTADFSKLIELVTIIRLHRKSD